MRIKIIRIRPLHGDDFYSLERSRFWRSLWYCEDWSDGGDLIKFSTHNKAAIAKAYSRLQAKKWLPCNLKNFGYEIVSEAEDLFC